MTSNDLCVTFDPYTLISYMKQGYMIVLAKFSGPWSIFVNEVAFSVKQPKMDNLTSGDLFLTSDLNGMIDFFLVLSMHTRCNKPDQNRTLFKIFAM